MNRPSWILAALTFCLLAGCITPKTARSVRNVIQPAIPSYHAPENGLPMRRVAVLPISFDEEVQSVPNGLDQVFHAELTKLSTFEVVPISREELTTQFGIMRISSVQIIPRDLLARLVVAYGVDGVLFTDVTHYFPYRPISIGVRCKLVDARSGVERWVFDHVFDTANGQVATAAKQFSADEDAQQLPIPSDGSNILQSPTLFGKYVAHETYRSLAAQ
jgi:hypothetical protein